MSLSGRSFGHGLASEVAPYQVADDRRALTTAYGRAELLPQFRRVRADDACGLGVSVERSILRHGVSVDGGLPPCLGPDTVVDIHHSAEVTMAKMTKYQRFSVLSADASDPICRGWIIAVPATVNALLREGWAAWDPNLRGARVTRSGLLAAGLDMDAIHGEAIRENNVREGMAADVASLHPSYKRFNAAAIQGRSYHAALDILHAEALAGTSEVTDGR